MAGASKAQLLVVSDAFHGALAQAQAAAADPAAPLPPVPVWADELRIARGGAPEAAPPVPQKPAGPKVDPEKRAAAQDAVQNCPVSKALAGIPEVTLDAALA